MALINRGPITLKDLKSGTGIAVDDDGTIRSTVTPEGLPAGGTTGQALVKASDADGDVEWGAVAAGVGDVAGPEASADGELALFSDDTGKALKRSNTLTGLFKLVAGVPTLIGAIQAWFETFATAANAAAARTAIGAQAQDSDLDAIAALSVTGFIAKTGSGAVAARQLTNSDGAISVSNPGGVAGNVVLGLVDFVGDGGSGGVKGGVPAPGAGDAAAKKVLAADGTWTLLDFLLALSGGTLTGDLTLAGDPTQALHAATKQYVDALAAGLDVKPSCRAATTANITLSGEQTIDGIAVVAGDRVLVKNQSTASQNGIYVAAAGAWARATDMDAWAEFPGAFFFVEVGTANAATGWVCTVAQGGSLGSTSVTFAQFNAGSTYTAGAGLDLTGNQFALASIATARLLGNVSGSSAAPTALTAAQVLTLLGVSAFITTLLDDADAATARATLGAGDMSKSTYDQDNDGVIDAAALPAGQDVVAADIAFAATDKLLGRATSGAGAGEEITCTAAGRAILDDADAAAQRTTLGAGDVNGQSSSVDSEIALFSGTGGKTIKRASTTGLLKGTSGVLSAAAAGTDYIAPGSGNADSSVSAASTTVAGKVEIATAAETTTGADATRAVSPDGLAGSDYGKRIITIEVFGPTTDCATGDSKKVFRIPVELNGYNLVAVAACVVTAGTTGTMDVQIHRLRSGTPVDMLSTKITIDSTELDTATAATAAVINTSNDDVATADQIHVDVDAVHTTAAKGLLVQLTFQLP